MMVEFANSDHFSSAIERKPRKPKYFCVCKGVAYVAFRSVMYIYAEGKVW